ncbi:MAG: deoxyribonucleoside 5'-monophosphate N-glycosidase [Methanosarcinales archaeon]|nr:deoxyribonucleoside 5'-monophosphate N-glycosidase [Methanosarcinales archaeon]
MTKVFMSGSMRGGRRLLDTYKFILKVLMSSGAEVLSQHVALDTIFEEEKGMSEEEIFMRDMGGVEHCECLIAEVTVPSIGVGYEICHAVSLGIPVLCLYKEGTKTSAMILGNKGVVSKNYSNNDELQNIIVGFIYEF